MTNRIRQVTIHDHSTTAADAEIRVLVVPEQVTPGTEIRGKFLGPSCRYSTTVEVAYHLRQGRVPAMQPSAEGILTRAAIPEASLWEPQCPFLYRGLIELWQDGQRCEQVVVQRGLRALSLGPRGLRINGKTVVLQGREVAGLSEQQGEELRALGCNLLLASLEPGCERVWELADRLGFLVLGRVRESEGLLAQARVLADHPSCFGWLFGPTNALPEGLPTGTWCGVEVGGVEAILPAQTKASFVIRPQAAGEESELRSSGVIGWVEGPVRLAICWL